jgi:hypothetical protein
VAFSIGMEAPGQELQDVSSLLAARSRRAQHALDEPTAPLAGRPATHLPPQYSVAQCPFSGIVRWLNFPHPEEGP